MSYSPPLLWSRLLKTLAICLLLIGVTGNTACMQIEPAGLPAINSRLLTGSDGTSYASESTSSHVYEEDTSLSEPANEDSDGDSTDAGSLETTYVATKILEMQFQSSLARGFTGTLVARRVSELGYKRIGMIEMLSVDQGDKVQAGQVVAMLDTRVLESEKAILVAQRDAATARLQELIAGPRKQTIDAAYSLLNEHQALRDQLRSTYQRRERLANTDAISVQDIDDARHQLAAAEAKIRTQEFNIAELEEGTRKEQIAAQKAEVARLDASITSVDVQIEESKLLAPYNGIVSRRFVDEGAIVQPGVPLFKIVELAPYEAWVGLPPEICSGLKIGDDYPLNLHGKTIPVRLKAILPELDSATRTQTAILDLDPNYVADNQFDQRLGAVGEIVNLELKQSIEQTGFWLPVSALTRGVKGMWSVFLVVKENETDNDWIVVRSDVEIAQIDSSRVLINGTVKNGDRVVTSGVQKLTPGQRVKIINDAQPEGELLEPRAESKQ